MLNDSLVPAMKHPCGQLPLCFVPELEYEMLSEVAKRLHSAKSFAGIGQFPLVRLALITPCREWPTGHPHDCDDVAPVEAVVKSRAHESQDVLPSSAWNFPAAHSEHTGVAALAAVVRYLPESHPMHLDLPCSCW